MLTTRHLDVVAGLDTSTLANVMRDESLAGTEAADAVLGHLRNHPERYEALRAHFSAEEWATFE